jgi:CDP-paratose synthetase
MIQNRTILITGATGFLGSKLLVKLVDAGYKVIVLARSSSKTTKLDNVLNKIVIYRIGHCDLDNMFSTERPDIIIHCATNYGRTQVDPVSVLEANLMLPLSLLQLGLKFNSSCFINTDTILDKRVSQYSLSKSQMKEWLKVFSDKITSINVALEHFYGPGDDLSKFASNIIHRILINEPEILLTPGRQKRDFVYIDDVVDAFSCVIDHCTSLEKGFHNFEIGTGKSVEIREFVSLVKEIAGNMTCHLKFGALSYRANEVMESHADLTAMRTIGWQPRVSLEDGLAKTIRLEKENIKL